MSASVSTVDECSPLVVAALVAELLSLNCRTFRLRREISMSKELNDDNPYEEPPAQVAQPYRRKIPVGSNWLLCYVLCSYAMCIVAVAITAFYAGRFYELLQARHSSTLSRFQCPICDQ